MMLGLYFVQLGFNLFQNIYQAFFYISCFGIVVMLIYTIKYVITKIKHTDYIVLKINKDGVLLNSNGTDTVFYSWMQISKIKVALIENTRTAYYRMDIIPKALHFRPNNNSPSGLYLGKFTYRYNIYHLKKAIIHCSGNLDIVDFPKHMWRYVGTT